MAVHVRRSGRAFILALAKRGLQPAAHSSILLIFAQPYFTLQPRFHPEAGRLSAEPPGTIAKPWLVVARLAIRGGACCKGARMRLQ